MSNAAQLEFALWILLAVALGAAIGLQRELRGHQAGIRTAALVAGGAAMFGRLSDFYGSDRIAAGVVQGIGFLGAGLILHRHGGVVRGATTAATIWVVAAVGLVVAQELWLAALILSAVYIAVLELRPLSDMVFRWGRRRAAAAGELPEESVDQA
jgi:putative Mg2+ transporter-C (MgtC) family protein